MVNNGLCIPADFTIWKRNTSTSVILNEEESNAKYGLYK